MVLEQTPISWPTVVRTLRTSVFASRWTHYLMPPPLCKSFKQLSTGNMQAALKKFNPYHANVENMVSSYNARRWQMGYNSAVKGIM